MAWDKTEVRLPQVPGWYLWHILDLSYLEVGAVEVKRDTDKHLGYLRDRIAEGKAQGFHLYQNDAGDWLTMYFEAAPHHLPPRHKDTRVPCVDRYVEFDFWWLVGRKNPLTPQPQPEPAPDDLIVDLTIHEATPAEQPKTYAYKYLSDWDHPLKACPACGHDWLIPGGISIELTHQGVGAWEVEGRLDAEGRLVDDSGGVAKGLHSATLCGGCHEQLIDLDGVCGH